MYCIGRVKGSASKFCILIGKLTLTSNSKIITLIFVRPIRKQICSKWKWIRNSWLKSLETQLISKKKKGSICREWYHRREFNYKMHLLLLWPSRLLRYNGFPSWRSLWTNSTLREDDQLLWYKSTYEQVHSLKYDLIRLFVVYQGDLKSWKILVLELRFLFVDIRGHYPTSSQTPIQG